MWAAALTSGPHVQTIGITTKPRQLPPPIARLIPVSTTTNISAQAQRRHRSTSPDVSEEELGCVGHAVLDALQSDFAENKLSKPPKISKIDSQKQRRKQRELQQKQQKEGKEINGSDVLLALQKVSADKSKRKKKEAAVPVAGRKTSGVKDNGAGDIRDVRPLRIKGNWGARLEELEKRIQGFVNVRL